jgi:serine/threonine protein kinase
MAVLYQIYHAREPPNILSHLSTELKDFIKCCMKIEPRDRWNVYKLLRHPFITGDVINFNNSPNSNNSPIGKSEFENKFCSEDKNSRYI